MWARSQDGTILRNITNFELTALNKKTIYSNSGLLCNHQSVMRYSDDENGKYDISEMATYLTKEKALSILDLIQKFILENGNDNSAVFEFPKDQVKGEDD